MALWRVRGQTLMLDRPAVMGILNITPDSFSDGGCYLDPARACARALRMEAEGAAVIDIGAQSTRPGAAALDPEEEWARLAPVLDAVIGRVSVPLSVDTFEPLVATRALQAGVHILNDVSGSLHNGFPTLAAQFDAGLIAMARDGQSLADVTAYFDAIRALTQQSGLPPDHLCLDMGIGFHADRLTDLMLIRHTDALVSHAGDCPLLCGASRKRVVSFAAGDCAPDDRLGGSITLHLAAALGGASLIRAHDVRETVQALTTLSRLQQLS